MKTDDAALAAERGRPIESPLAVLKNIAVNMSRDIRRNLPQISISLLVLAASTALALYYYYNYYAR